MERRIFLKHSAFATTLLALYHCTPKAQLALNSASLEASHRSVLKSLIPGLLGVKIASNGDLYQFESFLQNLETAVSTLPALTQKEIRLLFDLLANKLSRYFLLGLWGPLEDYSLDEVTAALGSWSQSSLTLKRSAYEGLRDIVLGTWYASPKSWQPIGYPGAPLL